MADSNSALSKIILRQKPGNLPHHALLELSWTLAIALFHFLLSEQYS